MQIALRRLSTLLMILALFCCASSARAGDDVPANVDDKSHRWLKKNMPRALPKLIQTRHGALERGHVFVVEELGYWGAGRGRGKHQGTDFVLDLPHKGKKESLFVGSLIDGTIAHVNPRWGSYGNTIFVYRDAKPKLVYIYAHLDSIDVEAGQKVKAGDVLGRFGCTGNCRGLRGKHLQNQVHVEIYVMPDGFKSSDINWGHLPMGQLRRAAVSGGKRPHGVDLSRYFGAAKIASIEREALAERYEKNNQAGGLDTFVRQKRKKRKKK